MRNKKGRYIKGHKISNTGRTWFLKGKIPWNKGLKGIVLKPRTGTYITCQYCEKQKYFQKNELEKRERKFCSLDCYHIASRKNRIGYQALHQWVRRKKGSAKKCIYCGSTQIVEWANKSQKYKKELDDWLSLCRKHHIMYDHNKLSLTQIYKKKGDNYGFKSNLLSRYTI